MALVRKASPQDLAARAKAGLLPALDQPLPAAASGTAPVFAP